MLRVLVSEDGCWDRRDRCGVAADCSSAEGSEGAASSAVSFAALAGGLRAVFLAVVAFLVRVLAAAGVSLAAAIFERSSLR